MPVDFQKILRRVVGAAGGLSLSGIDAPRLSETPGNACASRLARATGAFLLTFCGGSQSEGATSVLEDGAARGSSHARFLLRLSKWVRAEQQQLADRRPDLVRRRREAAAWAEQSTDAAWDEAAQKVVWRFLFPQGACCLDDPDQVVSTLRRRRTIRKLPLISSQ